MTTQGEQHDGNDSRTTGSSVRSNDDQSGTDGVEPTVFPLRCSWFVSPSISVYSSAGHVFMPGSRTEASAELAEVVLVIAPTQREVNYWRKSNEKYLSGVRVVPITCKEHLRGWSSSSTALVLLGWPTERRDLLGWSMEQYIDVWNYG